MFKRLNLPPGINRESTEYSAEGTWFDSNNIRFRGMYPECIGGWEQEGSFTLDGIGREIFSWSTYSGYQYICVATSWKFYVIHSCVAYDITPLRKTSDKISGGAMHPFAFTDGSSTLVVTDTAHGAQAGDFVTFEDVAASSPFTTEVMNKEYQIGVILSANTYNFTATDSSGTPVVASGSGSFGGNIGIAKYQISVGNSAPVSGSGWGLADWGGLDPSRAWGDPADLSITVSDGIRLCYVDNYGEDLMIANKNGEIYYWDVSSATTVSTGIPKSDGTERALPLDNGAFTGNSGTPEVIGSFLVSDRDGHVVAFQCNDIGASAKNSLLVRWSDQNNPFDWTPSATNTSGGQILRIGSRIVGGLVGREEILVWTDSAMYSMRYVGYPAMFSFSVVSGNVRIISSRSAVNVSSMIFFMGDDGFYSYAGSLAPLASTVEKYVFDDINLDESEKIFAGANSVFNEVFWIYPSSGSIEPDRYVLYNYLDQVWSIGNFDMSSLSLESSTTSAYNRTSWMDASIFGNPMATYVHQWDSTTTPSTQKTAVMMQEIGSSAQGGDMNSFVESGDMEISEGDRYALLNRIFPDVKFFDIAESASDPSLSISVSAKDFPGSAQSSISTVDVRHSVGTGLNGVGSVPPSGNATAIRGRGRAMSVKFSSDASNYKWRLGDTRIDMRPDGRR